MVPHSFLKDKIRPRSSIMLYQQLTCYESVCGIGAGAGAFTTINAPANHVPGASFGNKNMKAQVPIPVPRLVT